MLISIWNLKGGVGKTSLAYSIANDIEAMYITNDPHNSIVNKIYNKTIKELNEEIINENIVVFDGGGFFEKEIKSILKYSKTIIIPLEADINSANSLTNFLDELIEINSNIIFVINKVENNKASQKEFEEIKEFIKKEFLINENKIFKLSSSRIFKNIFEEEKGVNKIVNSNNTNKHIYRKINKEYNEILETIINI